MALPIQLKNKLDELHNRILATDKEVAFDKLLVGATLYKVRMRREIVDGRLRFFIEIKER